MRAFTHWREHEGAHPARFHKATLFAGDCMLVGLSCLDPGQEQAVHEHADQDKVYVVLEGRGRFTVGAEARPAGAGEIVWAPAGVPHGVRNEGDARLSLLVCIAPPPA